MNIHFDDVKGGTARRSTPFTVPITIQNPMVARASAANNGFIKQSAANIACRWHGKLDAQAERFVARITNRTSDIATDDTPTEISRAPAAIKPDVLSPLLAHIPQALRTGVRWVVWKLEGRGEGAKPTKVPYCPTLLNTRAKSNDPASWGAFEQAEAAYEEGGFDGVGVMLNGDGLVSVDIDGCVMEGKIHPEAMALMDSLGVEYVEYSPSGQGLRGFGYAENLERGANGVYGHLKVELYSNVRFMTVTGHTIEDGPIVPLSGFSELANTIRGNKKVNMETGQVERMPAALQQRELIGRIMSGDVFHDSLRDLAAIWVSNGMYAGGAVNALYALMDSAPVPHDGRWAARRAEIPRLVSSAVEKYASMGVNVNGIMASPKFVDVPDAVDLPVPPQSVVPPHLLSIPGKLGLMVDWTNATAMKPQPVFAVQAALALASVAMGRKFCTMNENWSSLFFLNIGLSGAGKEHAKTVIERVLRAAKFSELLAASDYTSDSAVDSMLRLYPTHIAIIDEFGLMLRTANAKNNTNAATARKRLMEVFGRCQSTLQPKAFSTAGLTKVQSAAFGPRHVENPALTLLGMTTPTPFYEAVGSGALTDGFLNRFIIVESDLGRQPSRFVEPVAVPDELVRWVRECRIKGHGDMTEIIDAVHSEVPNPSILEFSAAARRLFTELEVRCIARMDELDVQGMAEMYSRVREIAMRVSLIVAHSCESVEIDAQHAQWAIDYVTYWADRAISRLAENVADSPFAALCNDVANLIQKAGARGLTVVDLSKKSAKFKGTDGRMRAQVFDNLKADRAIRLYETKSPSGRGKTRAAYIAPDFIDQKQ